MQDIKRAEWIIGGSETPLLTSIQFHQNEILNVIIKSPNLDLNLCDLNGRSPLHHGAYWGNEEAVLLLLQPPNVNLLPANRYATDMNGRKPVDEAVDSGNLHIAAILQADAQALSFPQVAGEGRLLLVEAFVKQGVSVNLERVKGTQEANENPDTEKFLVGSYSSTPLIEACIYNSIEVLEFLLAVESINVFIFFLKLFIKFNFDFVIR